jgi:hypothetical protein
MNYIIGLMGCSNQPNASPEKKMNSNEQYNLTWSIPQQVSKDMRRKPGSTG